MTEGPNSIVLYVDDLWISPYVFSAFVALREKGMPFQTRDVALHKGDQKRPEYLDRTLTGRVPALQHGDFVLAESSAIAEYLEDVFAPPKYPRLFPQDLKLRARARQIMAWIRSDLMAIRDERPTTTMFYQPADQPLSAKGEEARDKLLHVANGLIHEGETSLFGEYSIADSDLAFMLQRLIINGHDVPVKVRNFAHAQWQRPGAQEYINRKRPPNNPY
jgi:glutathione S-transferase